MCGRYTLKTSRNKLAGQFELDELPDFTPRYNLGPTQDGLVVRTGDAPGTRTAAFLRWGLVPSWTKEGDRPPLLINLRSESVGKRPAFRDTLKRRRCLVLADGFFEWTHAGRIRQPHYLTVNGGEPFAMAGLWERWRPPGASRGEWLESFTILTTSANELVSPLHDRMPVILEPEFYEDWLNPALTDPESLLTLLRPYPSVRMFARAVSSRVNNIRNDDPACLDPPEAGEDAARAAPPPAPDREPRERPDHPTTSGQLDFDLGN